MKRFSILIVAVLVLSALGAGLAGAEQNTPVETVAPQQEGLTLVVGTTDDYAKLDPADSYSAHDWELLRNVSEGLVDFVPGTAEIEPRLATDFPTVSDDGLTYTFTLRDDAMFPDGTVLTAEMYVEWVQRSIALEGDPFTLLSDIASVEVGMADNEIVFTLSAPFGLFPMKMAASPPYFPFADGIFPPDEINNAPDATIAGVGPYQLVEYGIDQAVLQRNPNYYGEPGVYDEIVYQYYDDAAQLALAVESGDIDVANREVLATTLEGLAAQDNLTVLEVPGTIRYFLFNHDSDIGGNPLIRSAIAKAIDRDEMIDRALAGQGSPLYSFVPPGFSGSTESFLDLYGFRDLDGAIADLEEAGYTEDSPLELDLWYPPDHYGDLVADAMAVAKEQLEETGLIQVTLQANEWASYIGAATEGEYPFYFLGWFYDYPDSDNYIQPFASCDGSPGLGINFCSEDMDALIAGERSAVGDESRPDILAEAQDLFANDIVGIPLWGEPLHVVYDNTKVGGIEDTLGSAFRIEWRLVHPAE